MTSRYPHLTRERSEYDIIAPLLFLSANHAQESAQVRHVNFFVSSCDISRITIC